MQRILRRYSKRIISAGCIAILLLGLIFTIDLFSEGEAYAATSTEMGSGSYSTSARGASLTIGNTYSFGGYDWIAAEQGNGYVVMQSEGVTGGYWPGYTMAKFGNGKTYNKSIDGQDISDYNSATSSLYLAIKAAEYTSASYGKGLYLISKDKASGYYLKALQVADNNHLSFSARYGSAWLGTYDGGKGAYDVSSVLGVSSRSDQDLATVVAPAFNLNTSLVNLNGTTLTVATFKPSTGIQATQSKTTVNEGETVDLSQVITGVKYVGGDNNGKSAKYKISVNEGSINGTVWTAPKNLDADKNATLIITETGSGNNYSTTKNVTVKATAKETAVLFNTTDSSNSKARNSTISSDAFNGTVSWSDGSSSDVATQDMYVVPASIWDSWGEGDRTEQNVKSLTKYNGGKSIKLDKAEVGSNSSYKLYTVYFTKAAYKYNYFVKDWVYSIEPAEDSVTFSQIDFTQPEKDVVQRNDVIKNTAYEGKVSWSQGNTTTVDPDDLYVVPASIWDSWSEDERTKNSIIALPTKGEEITLDDSELGSNQTYSLYAVYFPEHPEAVGVPYFEQKFDYRIGDPYVTGLTAEYSQESVKYGATITNQSVNTTITLSDKTAQGVTPDNFFILATDTWNKLSDIEKSSADALKSVAGVNSITVPAMKDYPNRITYPITVVYFDYSNRHQAGANGTDCSGCTMFEMNLEIPLDVHSEYQSMLDSISKQLDSIKDNLGITIDFSNLTIQEKLDAISTEVDNLRKQKEENDKKLAEYQEAINKINDKLLNGNLSAEEMKDLQKNLDAILAEIDKLQTENKELNDKLTSSVADVETLKKLLEEAKQDNAISAEQIKQLEQMLEEAKKNNTESEEIKKLETLLEEAKQSNDLSEAEIKQLQELLEKAKQDGIISETEYEKTIAGLNSTIEELKKTISDQVTAISDSDKTIEELKKRINELLEKLNKKEDTIKKSDEERERLEKEIAQLKKEKEASDASVKSASAENQRLKSLVDNYEASFKKKGEDYEAALKKKDAEYEAALKEKDEAIKNAKNSAKTASESTTTTATTEKTSYTVRFETNGGSSVPDQSIASGSTASEPDTPVRSCYKFGGWYSDKGLTKPYSFSRSVKSDMVLYAKWNLIELESVDSTEESTEPLEDTTETEFEPVQQETESPTDLTEQQVATASDSTASSDDSNGLFWLIGGMLVAFVTTATGTLFSGRKKK